MAKTRKAQSIDAGKIESPIVAPNEEVQREFAEAAQLGSAGAADQRSFENSQQMESLSN